MTDPVTLWTSSEADQPLMARVLSSLIFSEVKFMQGFTDIVMELWNEWELRGFVLLSLFFQIILIIRGRARKSISKNEIRITLWCAYLMAEWAANFALGLLTRMEGKDDCKDQSPGTNNELKAFWAPFLLLHLGGPDTISAYSLEDNELWLRHLLGLFVQGGMAAYVSYKARNDSIFSMLTIPMFLAGMIKYGERAWVLRCMSSKTFRDSLLPTAYPGPNNAKFSNDDDFILSTGNVPIEPTTGDGFIPSTAGVIEPPEATGYSYIDDDALVGWSSQLTGDVIQATEVNLCSDSNDETPFVMSTEDVNIEIFINSLDCFAFNNGIRDDVADIEQSDTYVNHQNSLECFGFNSGLIRVEDADTEPSVTYFDPHIETLVKAYDFFSIFKLLFVDLILSFHDRDRSRSFFKNKSSKEAFEVVEIELGFMYDILFTKATVNYTLVGFVLRCITFSCTVIVFVFFLIAEKRNYSIVDQFITYLLLVVAIVLEIYAVILLLSSDWTNLWLSKLKNISILQLIISKFQFPSKRWSRSVAQYSLLSVCLEEKPTTLPGIQKLFCIYKMLEKHKYKTYKDVSERLENLIFDDLKKNAFSAEIDLQALCTCRGGIALQKYHGVEECEWSISAEFDRSILLWHIATELCYYHDFGDDPPPSQVQEESEISKLISDYMLYLLVMCSFMLPTGIGMIRFRDTRTEAMKFFRAKKSSFFGKAEACKLLLRVEPVEVLPTTIEGYRSKSVLFDSCRLAKSLLKNEGPKRWKMISHVWVEMLSYAACHCRGNYHARQLSQGGELLTHVWLLMAHLGITEQFQMDQGQVRAKLI